MAQPFNTNLLLSGPFPKPDELRDALRKAPRAAREIVTRLWLSEGIPYAFNSRPGIYEDMRGWLGARLTVHPKVITLIGSARLGYSLSPGATFGRAFNEESDLDLSIVSGDLFQRVSEVFSAFHGDVRGGLVKPRSSHEDALWKENLIFGERNIPLGFFDPNKIPNFSRYQVTQEINQSMWALVKKLEVTPDAPKPKRASARVYRDWMCFVNRVSLNLAIAV